MSFGAMNTAASSPEGPSADTPAVLALVRQAQEGSRDGFDEIVFVHRDHVYAAAWHLTRNADDALDVTQEVFLRAFRSLASFRGHSKFSTWLHRIMLNASVDYVRREKRHRNNVSETEFEDGPEGEARRSRPAESSVVADQREQVYAAELQKRVNGALSRLSARQREAFLLRYMQDLNLKEAAEAMRCSEGAVKRHLFRAQARLRELLEDLSPK